MNEKEKKKNNSNDDKGEHFDSIPIGKMITAEEEEWLPTFLQAKKSHIDDLSLFIRTNPQFMDNFLMSQEFLFDFVIKRAAAMMARRKYAQLIRDIKEGVRERVPGLEKELRGEDDINLIKILMSRGSDTADDSIESQERDRHRKEFKENEGGRIDFTEIDNLWMYNGLYSATYNILLYLEDDMKKQFHQNDNSFQILRKYAKRQNDVRKYEAERRRMKKMKEEGKGIVVEDDDDDDDGTVESLIKKLEEEQRRSNKKGQQQQSAAEEEKERIKKELDNNEIQLTMLDQYPPSDSLISYKLQQKKDQLQRQQEQEQEQEQEQQPPSTETILTTEEAIAAAEKEKDKQLANEMKELIDECIIHTHAIFDVLYYQDNASLKNTDDEPIKIKLRIPLGEKKYEYIIPSHSIYLGLESCRVLMEKYLAARYKFTDINFRNFKVRAEQDINSIIRDHLAAKEKEKERRKQQ